MIGTAKIRYLYLLILLVGLSTENRLQGNNEVSFLFLELSAVQCVDLNEFYLYNISYVLFFLVDF